MPAIAPARRLILPDRRIARPGLGKVGPRDPYFPSSLYSSGSNPIHLIAQTTVQSGGSSGVNQEALRNPLDLPMEILEIKFQIRAVTSLPQTTNTPVLTGASIAAEFALDSIPLTAGFVPLWCFGKSLRVDLAEVQPFEITNGPNFHGHYRWRLSSPLFIAPGQVLTPKFAHLGDTPAALKVIVSYSGRTLPKGYQPKKTLTVPYAAYYASKVFNGFNGADTDTSKETDLRNPFDIPIRVERLVGRINSKNTTSLGTVFTDQPDFGADLLTTRIYSSAGEPLVPAFSIFQLVFNHTTKTWECPHLMPPRSFYLVELSLAAPVTTNANFQMQAFVSMVGSRDLELKR